MKKNLAAIVKTGMTGAELGRLMIQDIIDSMTGKHIFTKEDKQSLISKLPPEERRVYGQYFEIANTIKYNLLSTGHVAFLTATNDLNIIKGAIMSKRAKDLLREEQERFTLVTEKQYKDLAEAQKPEKLKEMRTISHVILDRATYYAKHPELIPKLWKQYEEDRIKGEKIKRENKEKEGYIFGTDLLTGDLFDNYGDDAKDSAGINGFGEEFPELGNKILDELRALVQKKKLSIKLSQLDSKKSATFKNMKVSRAELYKAGLPEQIEYIEKYQPGFLNELKEHRSMAILVDPPSYYLDKNGYFDQQYHNEHTIESAIFIEGQTFFEKEEGIEILQKKAEGIEQSLLLGFICCTVVQILLQKIGIQADVLRREINMFYFTLSLYKMHSKAELLELFFKERGEDKELREILAKRYLLPLKDIDINKLKTLAKDTPRLQKIREHIDKTRVEDIDTMFITDTIIEAMNAKEK